MGVRVNEARGHDRTGSIELPFAVGSQPRADLHNSAISNSDVTTKCCLAGPIDDAPATNEKISHGPTPCASQCLFIRRLRPHPENATSEQIAGPPASPQSTCTSRCGGTERRPRVRSSLCSSSEDTQNRASIREKRGPCARTECTRFTADTQARTTQIRTGGAAHLPSSPELTGRKGSSKIWQRRSFDCQQG